MVKRNAHCCGRVILLELAHCEIRVGHIPRRIHCVSPDRLLLRFFCQRVFSESSRTALGENLIALVNTYRDDANGCAFGQLAGGKTDASLYHKGTRNSPRAGMRRRSRKPGAAPFGRCTVLRSNARAQQSRGPNARSGACPCGKRPSANTEPPRLSSPTPAKHQGLPQQGNFPGHLREAAALAQPPAADSARAFDLFLGLTTISTRRLLARPSAVSFVATGRSSPRPCA
jgi:hypothetical protein